METEFVSYLLDEFVDHLENGGLAMFGFQELQMRFEQMEKVVNNDEAILGSLQTGNLAEIFSYNNNKALIGFEDFI